MKLSTSQLASRPVGRFFARLHARIERTHDVIEPIAAIVKTVATFCVATALVVLFFVEMFDPSIVIEPFSVPKSVADSGFTPEASAAWLRDQLQTIANTSWGANELPLAVDAPGSADVTIPGVGITLGALAHGAADILGVHTRHQISGAMTLRGGKLFFHLLYDQQCIYDTADQEGVDPQHPEVLLIVGSRVIVDKTNPAALANYILDSGDLDAARDQAQKIVAAQQVGLLHVEKPVQPESSFTQIQKARAYVLLGRISDKLGKSADAVRDYDKAIGIGADTGFVHEKLKAACKALEKAPDAAGENKDAMAICQN